MKAMRALAATMILVLAACAGSDPDATASSETTSEVSTTGAPTTEAPTTTEAATTTEAPTTTEAEPETVAFALPTDVDALASALVLTSDDIAAPQYELAESAQSTELCIGVDAFTVLHPPEAFAEVATVAGHTIVNAAYVYENETAAIAALAALSDSLDECSGVMISDEIDAEQLAYYFRYEDEPTRLGYDMELTTVESTVLLNVEGEVVDRTLLLIGASDPELTSIGREIVTSRAAGVDPGLQLEPVGTQEVYAGFLDAAYWSWEDGPDAVRSAAAETAFAEWVEGQDDAGLDAFSSQMCASAWTATGSGTLADLDAEAQSLSGLDGSTATALTNASLEVYCPFLADAVEFVRAG